MFSYSTPSNVCQAIGIGDEGGFAPLISKPQEALDLLNTAVENCGYTGMVKFGIDPASSEFFGSGTYDLGFKDAQEKSSKLSSLPPSLVNSIAASSKTIL
jgi:enolase